MEPDGRGGSGVVAVAGEALIDLLPREQGLFEAVPGGSPANVAVGLARLGVPTRMLARIAADVVKASADDLAWLLPGRAAGEAAVEWLAKGPAIVAITLGAAGAVAAAARSRPPRTSCTPRCGISGTGRAEPPPRG